MSTDTDIPTLTTTADAEATLRDLAETHDWVSVFWDRGWGDSGQPLEISIIVDGDGQNPKAWITREVYQALGDSGVIGENTLMTYKARKLHDYKTPPPAEPTGPNPTEVAEQAVRRFMDAHPDLPVVARFYRGLSRGPFGPQVDKETVATPAADAGRFVLILPGCSDAAISAQEPDFLGHRIVGGGLADTFGYPRTDAGEVDVVALAGEGFQAQLAAVVAAKVAVLDAARAEVSR